MNSTIDSPTFLLCSLQTYKNDILFQAVGEDGLTIQ